MGWCLPAAFRWHRLSPGASPQLSCDCGLSAWLAPAWHGQTHGRLPGALLQGCSGKVAAVGKEAWGCPTLSLAVLLPCSHRGWVVPKISRVF